MSYRYIRRKENPLVVLKGGYVAAGGLGSFDPVTYEEVEGELPMGYSWDPGPTSNLQRLAQVKVAYQLAPVSVRIEFGTLAAQVELFLRNDDLEAAQVLVQGASIPVEHQSLQQAILAILQAG